MSSPQPDVIWTPDPARVAAAAVTEFREQVRSLYEPALADYASLYEWSCQNPAVFWRSVWDFCGVIGDGELTPTLVPGDDMRDAVWFPHVRLNFARNLLEVGAFDTAEAVVFRGEDGLEIRLTWGELRSDVAALAAALRADGIGPGDRVAGFMPNIPQTLVAMLAAASVGAVWSSCSPDFGSAGVLDRFGQVEPRVLFVADGYRYGERVIDSLPTARELASSLRSLERVVVVPFVGSTSPLPAGAKMWDDYAAQFAGAAPVYAELPFAHPLYIMFSSGTTGLPKCMVHSAGGTLLQHLKEHRLHCDMRPGDRVFYFTTCGWMMWNWLVSSLASGATVMLYDGHPLRPAATLWDFAAAEKCQIFGTSARWLSACEKAGLRPRQSHDLSSLRTILSTGSPLSPESFDYVYRDVHADVQLSSISGGTDIISCFALGSPVLPVRRGELQCRGLGMSVAVWQDNGPAATGQKGELVCTAPFPSMPTAFWRDPDGQRYHQAYFARYEGIWCHGDFAELTASGGMVIHGRSDAVLNPGGVRIGTAEIYRVVEQFPQVVASVLVGLPRDGDVIIALFVQLQPGLHLSTELVESIKERVRREKTPRHVPGIIRQVPDIPRTLSGKIVELAVGDILQGKPVDNRDALANPEALEAFRVLASELS